MKVEYLEKIPFIKHLQINTELLCVLTDLVIIYCVQKQDWI